MSWGGSFSTVQPTLCAVPRISLTVPDNSIERDLSCALIVLASSMIVCKVKFPLCLMFFTFFLSRAGSFNAWKDKQVYFGKVKSVKKVWNYALGSDLDDKWRGTGDNVHSGLSVLDGEPTGDSDSLVVFGCGLHQVISNLLRRQTKGTDFGGQRGCGRGFSSVASHEHLKSSSVRPWWHWVT